MVDTARILALSSAVFLAAFIAILAKMLQGPLLQRLDGKRASNGGAAELASQLLVVAFLLGALAAFLAIVASISS